MKTPITYGDKVYCKIRGNTIVPVNTKKYDVKLEFEIIGYSFEDGNYILYVPRYYDIRNSWRIKEEYLDDFLIQKKFKSKKAVAVTQDKIVRAITKTNQDGMFCAKCGKFCHLAEANQDGGSFICYSCRNNPYQMCKPDKVK